MSISQEISNGRTIVDGMIKDKDGNAVAFHVITGKDGKPKEVRLSVPLVSARGQLQEVDVSLTLANPGLRLVIESQGELQLTKRARDRGFVFYKDICFGKIEGVPASPKHWALWEAVRDMRRAGKQPGRGTLPPEKLYHPYVLHLRKSNAGQFQLVEQAGIDAMLDEIMGQGDGGDVEAARAEAKRMGATVPAAEPTRKSKGKTAEKTLAQLVEDANG